MPTDRAASYRIEPLTSPVSAADLRSLAELLLDTVQSGSAVSFLASLRLADAESWWQKVLAGSGSAVFLVARDDQGIAGTVQLHRAWAPNQPHRADVAKLMVHRRTRRTGLGSRLMSAIEGAALEAGITLLTLDTKKGEPAEQLYRKLGWTAVGAIPRYALDPDGTPHDTVLFYKELTRPDFGPDRFEERPAMLLGGLRRHFDLATVEVGIAEQWRALLADAPLPGRIGDQYYGVMCGGDGRTMEYMCGVQVASLADLPEGTGKMRVPAQRYAVFAHDGDTTLRDTWMRIFDWLATSGYASAETPDFEVYPAGTDPRAPRNGVEVWVGIR